MKESYVFLADGFEEMEALSPIDILRRAGMSVKTVSISSSLRVTGAHGVGVTADMLFDTNIVKEADWLILPGGMPGAVNLYDFAPLQGALRQHNANGGHIAAICASPAVILGQLGLLDGRKATCYPGMEGYMPNARYCGEPVSVDGNIVTGNGPASAMLWAITIVKTALGTDKALSVANELLYYPRRDDAIDHYFG